MGDLYDDAADEYLNGKKKASKIDELEPDFRSKIEELQNRYSQMGKSLKVREAYRSPETQNNYYAQGRTRPGNIITHAKGGQSDHQYRQAIDIDPSDGDYQTLGKIAK